MLRRAELQYPGQVSWLTDLRCFDAFPSEMGQWRLLSDSSPFTVALPRRIHTVFPINTPWYPERTIRLLIYARWENYIESGPQVSTLVDWGGSIFNGCDPYFMGEKAAGAKSLFSM